MYITQHPMFRSAIIIPLIWFTKPHLTVYLLTYVGNSQCVLEFSISEHYLSLHFLTLMSVCRLLPFITIIVTLTPSTSVSTVYIVSPPIFYLQELVPPATTTWIYLATYPETFWYRLTCMRSKILISVNEQLKILKWCNKFFPIILSNIIDIYIIQWNLSIAGMPWVADKIFSPKCDNVF